MKRKHLLEDDSPKYNKRTKRLTYNELQHNLMALEFLIYQMGKEKYQKMIIDRKLPEDYEKYFTPLKNIKNYDITYTTLTFALLYNIENNTIPITFNLIPEVIQTGFFSNYKNIQYPFNITENYNTRLNGFVGSENYNRCFKLLYDHSSVFKYIENDINYRLDIKSKTIEIIPDLSWGKELKNGYITLKSGYKKINIPIKNIDPNDIFNCAFEKAEKTRILDAIDNKIPYVIIHIGYSIGKKIGHANSVIIDRNKKKIIYLETYSELGPTFEALPIHAFNIWCHSSDNLNVPDRNYTFIAYAVGVQNNDVLCYLWSYLLPLMYVLNPDINIFELYDELIKGTNLKYTIMNAFLFYICNTFKITSDIDSKLDKELIRIVGSINNNDEFNKLFIDILNGKYDEKKELDLSGTLIKDLSPLSLLIQLQELDLSNTKIEDISPLSSLKQLQKLDLSNCDEIKDLSPLSTLKQLQKLDLSNTYIEDLSPLEDLKLQKLDLSNTYIEDFYPLSSLIQLQELNLSNTYIEDLSPLTSLNQLQKLSLSKTIFFNHLSPLSSLTQLQELDLSNCEGIEDISPLSNLINLQILDLRNCDNITEQQINKLQDILQHITIKY